MAETLSARQILERLVAFPTVSDRSNLDLIDWVEAYLSSHGILVGRFVKPDDPGKAALYAHVGPMVEGGVLLSGHTDVVPVEGQAWSSDPFALCERDGKLFGRGACDMKGFDALAIWALVAAQGQAVSLGRPLQLALSYDEEIGCAGAPPLIAAMSGLPRAHEVIVGEPTLMKPVVGHKGGVSFDIHVRGFEVHSSRMHLGVSAIMWGAKLIDWANGVNAAQALAAPSEMAARFDPPWTNVHVGLIRGGTAHNITAKDCHFSLGFRVVPGEALEHWQELLEAEADRLSAEMQAVHPDTGITVEQRFSLPPFAPQRDNAAEALVRQLTGQNETHVVSFGTEASHFQAAGHPVVVCGPGSIAVAHQPDEFLSLQQLCAGQAFMERLLALLT